MNIESMRQKVKDEYPGRSWKARVEIMPDAQVIAIYYNIIKRVHSPKLKVKKSDEVGYQFTIKDYIFKEADK